jgi:DNA sulfur modification protein DndD
MIIEKIELENFMCYAGSNCINFKEGINVIIGDNGYGKSKLYDAFYWVMYDQIFDTEGKEFVNTRIAKSKIISDKAKANVTNGRIGTTVSITFHNLEKDNVYILERKYIINVINSQITESNDSEFTIMQKDLSYLNAKMVNDEEEKYRIMAKILPPQIKDYLWFQGEQVESIIDFKKQDTLTKAINVLSSITRYDELRDIAITSARSANCEYDRELKRLSKDFAKSEQLEKEKSELEKKNKGLLLDLNEAKDNLSKAESKCEELLNKIEDAQKINELLQVKKSVLERLKDLNNELIEEQITFYRKMFRNKWILKGTENLFNEYSQKFSTYEQLKLKLAAEKASKLKQEKASAEKLQTRLPFNVPEPNYLEWMLDKERCLVCDREAVKGSDPWHKIKELLDRPVKGSSTDDITKQNLNEDLKRLYQNGLSLSNRIIEIDEDINEVLKKRNSLNVKVKNVNNELKKLEDSIQKLLANSSLTTEIAKNIIDEYSVQNAYAKKFSILKERLSQQIDTNRNCLRVIEDQLKALVTGEIPKWLIEKKETLNDFEAISISTRERVFNGLITQLEKEANKHYKVMTSGNKSSRGQIVFRKLPNGNYMPEITNLEGIPLRGVNTSNLILVKLAAIMAIVSAKSGSNAVNLYTLITDAPTSVFGEDYTIGFCKTVSKVYKQSIIMSKEFYKNQTLRNELLANPEINIGKVYMITPSIIESERTNRDKLSTKIEPLN